MSVLAAWPRHGYLPIPDPADPTDPTDPTDPPDPDPPEAWITHPGTDRAINQMLTHNGVIHIAHGAWVGGAHNIVWVTMGDETPRTGPEVPSEGFQVVREYGGSVFLPWQDPTGPHGSPQDISFTTDNGASWQRSTVGPAAHFFDLRETDGVLYLAGSEASAAMIWQSPDAGLTWSESLRVEDSGTTPRFVHVIEAAGTLWCRPTTVSGEAYRLHQGSWEVTSAPVPAGDGHGFGMSAGGVSYGIRNAFDGARVVPYSHEVRGPSWADGSHVYAANPSTGAIDRAALLQPEHTEVAWEPWLDLGPGMPGTHVTTATLHDGYVYVGGTQGRIWRLPAP